MKISTRDRNSFSFGRLSDPDVLRRSPLYGGNIALEHFSDRNLQHIVNNIADMFGYTHNAIHVQVDGNDAVPVWSDSNQNQQIDDGELSLHFTMNASMNSYQRVSVYGKNFMYYNACKYGYPLIFGIAAHEVGHLVGHRAMDVLETKIVNGLPALVITQRMHPYWDELCADYLSGIVLAKANPPLDGTPQKEYLSTAKAGPMHPDGYLRSLAFQVGYQWGRNNPPMKTDQILTQTETQKKLLISFYQGYYSQVYMRIGNLMRRHLTLPAELMQQTNYFLGDL